jgi:hypothetical protein
LAAKMLGFRRAGKALPVMPWMPDPSKLQGRPLENGAAR